MNTDLEMEEAEKEYQLKQAEKKKAQEEKINKVGSKFLVDEDDI